jgi:MFS family permease
METRRRLLPDIARLWVIGGNNNVVRWLELLAAGLFTFELTGSGFAVAAVSAARTLPMLVFGAFAGVISEAFDRKRILIGGQCLTALSSASICALAAAGRAEPWAIAIAAFVCGTVWSAEMSSRRRMVGDAAAPGMLSRAIAVDSLAGALTRMVGPLLGGLAYGVVGLPGAYGVTTVLSLINIVLALPLAHRQATRPLSPAAVLRDLRDGLRSAVAIPEVAAVLAVTVAMNTFCFSYSALVAPVALRVFAVPNELVGFLGAAEPAGALLAGLYLARRTPAIRPRVLMIAGSALFALALLAMPHGGSFALACLILLVGGTGMAAFSNMQTLVVLTAAPPALRSRLLGLITACIGTGPLGQLVIGALADGIGLKAAIGVMASIGLCAILAVGHAWRHGERGTRGGLP